MSNLIAILVILFTSVRLASAQISQPNNLAELVAYMGADREKILFARAKAEGKVVWYTSLSGGSYKALAQAFEAKYPGVKVEVYRASGSDLAARMTEEARARRYIVDALETTSDSLLSMREAGLLGAFNSPYIRNYPPEAREKADKGLFFWTIARESYVGFGYNKNRIPPDAVPKGFEGLLNPALKGHLAVGTGGTGARAIGAMLKVKGEAFVKKLKAQDIRVFALGSVGVRDQIAAGEISGSPIIFRTHALEAMEKGAPVDWVPMELVPVNAGAPVLAARPPHSHAALLMVDFLLGPDGQAILEKYKYGSATKDYGFKRWYDGKGLTTEQYEQEVMKWEKLLRSIVRK
ncbi:MAG: extracellular solute-binding protein [Deltaproteobacteria bacterium]|nr:extracellular solute-binding protein [Deltaproteobacteria bacterium]